MATKRIKNLNTIAPDATKWLAHEGDVGGTGKASLQDVVQSGVQALGIIIPGGPLVDITDDFIDAGTGDGWVCQPKNTAYGGLSPSFSALGFKSSGVAAMGVATTGDSVLFIKPGLGLVLGAATPIVAIYTFAKAYDTSVTPIVPGDTQCSYEMGIGALDNMGNVTDGVLVEAKWSGGVRSWKLATVKASVTTEVAATMPAGTIISARITVTEGGATLEVSVDGGAYSLLSTSAVAPTQTTYVPLMFAGTDTGGSGQRLVPVDSARFQGTRAAADAGAGSATNPPLITWPLAFPGFGTTSATACVGNDSRLSNSRAPTAHASSHGDDGGDAITIDGGTQIESATITDVQVAVANKDGASGAASMRTLGAGSTQACAGNDSRLSDSRAASSIASAVLVTAAASLAASLGVNSQKITSLLAGTANTDAVNFGQLSQPLVRVASAGFTFAAGDIGAVVRATGAGAQAATLNTLASSLISGSELLLTVQQEGAATQVTVTPDGSSQIDGAGVGVAYVATAGRTRFTLMSADGLNWFSGKS